MAGLKGFFSFELQKSDQGIIMLLTAIVAGHSLWAARFSGKDVELDQIAELIVFSIPFLD